MVPCIAKFQNPAIFVCRIVVVTSLRSQQMASQIASNHKSLYISKSMVCRVIAKVLLDVILRKQSKKKQFEEKGVIKNKAIHWDSTMAHVTANVTAVAASE